MKAVYTVSQDKDYQEILSVGGHELLLDSLIESGGGELGPSPHDLLTGALLGCKAMTMRMYAKRKNWDLAGLKLSGNQVHIDRNNTRFEITIEFPNNLTDEQKQRLLEISTHCPVHKSLIGQVEIASLEGPVAK
ncbi:OsmC family protein [bacterium]|nr:OsmC family protein [bacterium]